MKAAVPSGSEWDAQTRSEVPPVYRDKLLRTNSALDQLRGLMQLRVGRILFELGLTVGSLLAVPLLYRTVPGRLTFVVCFLLSVRTFNCFAQLVHSSDHGGLFADSRLNRVVGNLCAYCLGYTRSGHRLAHLQHHQYLNTPRDPDRIWGAPDQPTRDLLRMWLRDLLFLSALERLLQYWQSDRKNFSVSPWKTLTVRFLVDGARSMFPVVVTQGLIFGLYAVLLGPLYYLGLYVLPILTLYPAQIRLRSTAEHSFDVGYRPVTAQDRWVSRSTDARWLERFIVSPLGIHYHFEHHLFPGVPHYNLPKVRKLLVTAGFPVPVTRGYLAFVVEKMRTERQALISRQEA